MHQSKKVVCYNFSLTRHTLETHRTLKALSYQLPNEALKIKHVASNITSSVHYL